ncbi:hypothetical protein IE81DRAFT_206845 [Ceraceosorus guamensis]|uniref:YTH domain-containing protein n=1 Tax=Ceraceosorus guamensis TaxID=1522189 RepID=A0A316W6B7_9BASI|nr:hypothetical protein IE81DRAFT_206845 [Ceraceosorus guamensis]PWN45174.1 hypothetical protein IE81DRAFT_206845 [Ceraceosorus guamensis]
MASRGNEARRGEQRSQGVPPPPPPRLAARPQAWTEGQQASMTSQYHSHPGWNSDTWSQYGTQPQMYAYRQDAPGMVPTYPASNPYGPDMYQSVGSGPQEGTQTAHPYQQSYHSALSATQLQSPFPSRQQSYDSAFYYPAGVASSPYSTSSPGHSDPSAGTPSLVTHHSPPGPSLATSPGPESSQRSSSGGPAQSVSPAPMGDFQYPAPGVQPGLEAYAYSQHAQHPLANEGHRPPWTSRGPVYGVAYHEGNFAGANNGVWYSYEPQTQQPNHAATRRPPLPARHVSTYEGAPLVSGSPSGSQPRADTLGQGASRPAQHRAPHTWTPSVPQPPAFVGGYGYAGHYPVSGNAYYPPAQQHALNYATAAPLQPGSTHQFARVGQSASAARPMQPPRSRSQAGVAPIAHETAYSRGRAEGKKRSNMPPGATLRPRAPAPDAPRSQFVMWMGNIPSNATSEELHGFLSQLTQPADPSAVAAAAQDPDEQQITSEVSNAAKGQVPALAAADTAFEAICEGHGIVSIFVIARSNCAFVNYATVAHLDAAVDYFHDKQLRPLDASSVRLVCRVRKKEDESQAGVEGQRGRGIHVALVKEYERQQKQKAAELEKKVDTQTAAATSVQAAIGSNDALKQSQGPSTEAEAIKSALAVPNVSPAAETASMTSQRPSIGGATSSSGSISISTNSSLLKHQVFRQRFFILKSLYVKDLDQCLATSIWATQPHNEAVLDQAYRNSEAVYLIFSANQSGNFYGYARMAGSIATPPRGKGDAPTSEGVPRSNAGDDAAKLSVIASGLPRAAYGGSQTPQPGQVRETSEDQQRIGTAPQTLSAASPGLTPNIAASPLQLTPVEEIDQPVAEPSPPKVRAPLSLEDQTKSILSATWPPDTASPPHPPSSAGRGTTLSPKLIPSRPDLEAERGDEEVTTGMQQSIAVSTADNGKSKTIAPGALSPIRSLPVPADSEGVKRIDTVQSERDKLSGSPTESTSLGPADSVSVSGANEQAQMSIRAMIHNLRLEEREAQRQANALEGHLVALGEGSLGPREAHGVATPRARPTDAGRTSIPESGPGLPNVRENYSWGRPFRVQWLMSTPLPFSKVRKLRNPWRDGKPVMVSRDGTEVEPNTGRQLIEEWARHVASLTNSRQEASISMKSSGDESSAVSAHIPGLTDDVDDLSEEVELDVNDGKVDI